MGKFDITFSHKYLLRYMLSNADSVVRNEEENVDYFVKPHTAQGSFAEFLDYLQDHRVGSSDPVQYAQSRKSSSG